MASLSVSDESDVSVAPSTAVIEAVADYRRTDPIDLERPLYEVIDPDALDALFYPAETGHRRSSGFIEFAYDGCRVKVDSDGSVEVLPPASE